MSSEFISDLVSDISRTLRRHPDVTPNLIALISITIKPTHAADMPPAPKKPKLFRACEACVNSKTRCEDVTPEGCGHCRRRRKQCSLQAIVGAYVAPSEERYGTPGSEHHAAGAGEDVRALRSRLAETEARLASLERMSRHPPPPPSYHYSPGQPGPATPRTANFNNAPAEPRLMHGALQLASMYHQVQHDETLFSAASTRPYRSPTSVGLTPDQIEMAWHQFKARITSLLPLPPFTAVSTPVPEHPFVQTAMLQFVPSLAGIARPLVDEGLLLAMAGHATRDVVLALLILSLAPGQAEDEPGAEGKVPEHAPVTPSAFRLVALAYSMGSNLGMQSAAEAALRADLDSEHWDEMRFQLLMWTAVVNRYSLLSLMYGKSVTLPPLVAPRLPPSKRESVQAAHAHLRAEASVVSAFLPLAKRLNDLEHALSYDADEVSSLQSTWKAAFDAAAPYVCDSENRAVRNDARLIQFVLGFRIASLSTWIPSPLIEAREAALKSLHGFPSVMIAVVDILVDSDPKRLPAYMCVFIAIASLCLRRAVLFVQYTYNHQLIDSRRLDQAEAAIIPINAQCRFILHHAGEMLKNLPYGKGVWGAEEMDNAGRPADSVWSRNGQVQAPPSFGVELDIMNWDLSLLYPDLNSFPTTMSM